MHLHDARAKYSVLIAGVVDRMMDYIYVLESASDLFCICV